jgi:hypothetical protein
MDALIDHTLGYQDQTLQIRLDGEPEPGGQLHGTRIEQPFKDQDVSVVLLNG